ncbi:hypothetical protein Deiofobo_0377 [Pseudomonas phage Deifobo]|nr:hypothetical protein Deiofobo_0377 [Pseudomonas phage Deifobo]
MQALFNTHLLRLVLICNDIIPATQIRINLRTNIHLIFLPI